MVATVNPSALTSLGMILSNNTSALSLPARLETAVSELEVVSAYGSLGWSDVPESLRGESVTRTFQAIDRVPEILSHGDKRPLFTRLSAGDTKGFLQAINQLRLQLEPQLSKVKEAALKELGGNLERIRAVVSAGRPFPAGLVNIHVEDGFDPTRDAAKRHKAIQEGTLQAAYRRRRIWIADLREGAGGVLRSLWSPVKIHHKPAGQPASTIKLIPGIAFPLAPEDRVSFGGQAIDFPPIPAGLTYLPDRIQRASSLQELMSLLQSVGYTDIATQIENFLRTRTPITRVPNEDGLAKKIDQLLLCHEFQFLACRYFPGMYPDAAFAAALSLVQTVAGAPSAGSLVNVLRAQQPAIGALEGGLRNYFGDPVAQNAAAIPTDFGLQKRAVELMPPRMFPAPAPRQPTPIQSSGRPARPTIRGIAPPPQPVAPTPLPAPAPAPSGGITPIPQADARREMMVTKVNGESDLLNTGGQPIGRSYLVSGGEEGELSLRLSDGSIISAKTSKGTRGENQDGYYVGWYRLHDGSLVKVIVSSDGAGGAACGEMASSAFLQGVHQRLKEAAARSEVPLASDLFSNAVTAVQKQVELNRHAKGATGTASVIVIHGNYATASTVADDMTFHAVRRGMYFVPNGYSEIQNQADNIIIAGINADGGKHYKIRLRPQGRLAHGSDGFWQNILGVAYKNHGSPVIRENAKLPPPAKPLFAAICGLFQATQGNNRAAHEMFKLALDNQTTPHQQVDVNGVSIQLPEDADSDNIVVVTYEHPSLPDQAPVPAQILALPDLEKIAN